MKVVGFHETDRVFNEFSLNTSKRSHGTNAGVWFSECPHVAHTYTNHAAYNENSYLRALDKGDLRGESIGNSSIIKSNLKFDNPLIFDAKGNHSGDLKGLSKKFPYEVSHGIIKRFTIADLYHQALENGHDGIVVKNVDDCGGNPYYVLEKRDNVLTTIFGVASVSQIKPFYENF